MTILQKLIALTVTVMTLCAVSYMAGGNAVREEWNKEKAVRAALLDAEKKRNLKTVAELKDKHQKEMDHAKTKAGRDAVNRWLREHCLLPSQLQVRDCGSKAPADRAKVPDGRGEEQRTGGGIEGFAINCADDASRLTDWQTLCKSQGCVVE